MSEEELLNLPILPGEGEGEFFVLLPGLHRDRMKQWEATWRKDSLLIEVYYGGFDDEGNLRGSKYPIQWPEGWDQTEEEVRLIPVNPTNVNFERYFDQEEAKEYEEFFRRMEEKF